MNTNFQVIGLTRLEIKSQVYRSRSRRSFHFACFLTNYERYRVKNVHWQLICSQYTVVSSGQYIVASSGQNTVASSGQYTVVSCGQYTVASCGFIQVAVS